MFKGQWLGLRQQGRSHDGALLYCRMLRGTQSTSQYLAVLVMIGSSSFGTLERQVRIKSALSLLLCKEEFVRNSSCTDQHTVLAQMAHLHPQYIQYGCCVLADSFARAVCWYSVLSVAHLLHKRHSPGCCVLQVLCNSMKHILLRSTAWPSTHLVNTSWRLVVQTRQ